MIRIIINWMVFALGAWGLIGLVDAVQPDWWIRAAVGFAYGYFAGTIIVLDKIRQDNNDK